MKNLINLLTISGDAIIIYGLILFMAILLVVIFVLDFKSKKKSLENSSPIVIEGATPIEKYETYDQVIDNLSKNEEILEVKLPESKPETVLEEKKDTVEVVQPKDTDNHIKYVIQNEEEEKEEAKEELKELVQELKEEKEENIDLTDFEVEQEENAIISYNELKKVSDTLYDNNEMTQYQDEGNEPISIAQLQEKFKEVNETVPVDVTSEEEKSSLLETIEILETPKVSTEDKKEKMKLDDFAIKTGDHKFKISPIISPVYGTMKEEPVEINDDFTSSAKLKLEQTANLEKLDEELRKTNEFLAVLKELQKKLDS